MCSRCEKEPALYHITFWQVAQQQQQALPPVIIGSTESGEFFGIRVEWRTWVWVPYARSLCVDPEPPLTPPHPPSLWTVLGFAPRLARGQRGKQAARHSFSLCASVCLCVCVCVCVCVAAAHSVLFDSTGLIRHPVPWQRQGLNSSVKSLSTQTHAHSP